MTMDADMPRSIRDEASRWFAERQDEVIALDAEKRFAAWIDADPRHAEAYEALWLAYDDIASLKHLGALAPLEEASPRRWWRGPAASRLFSARGVYAAIAASLLLVVTLSFGIFDTPGVETQTRLAETRVLTLADGSRVTLGARSSIRADMSGADRRVELVAGQAFFEVAHDAKRPFFVEAGDTRVRVVGTKFDVNMGISSVKVAVLEGVVEVEAPAPLLSKGKVAVLRQGQRIDTPVSVSLFASATPAIPVQTAETAPGGWRSGRLAYADERLGDVVSDLNRYYAPGIRITDPALADMRVAASLRPDEVESFVDNLPMLVGAKVERGANGAFVVSKGAP